jgi:aminoglycoside phosphotransferase (APT) family kinase protein
MRPDLLEEAAAILQEWLPGHRWTIERPSAGWRKACYIAASAGEKCFIKFDVPISILRRLGEIRVAPRVLFSGTRGGVSYVIQEFVSGLHPQSQAWMRQHVDALAAIVRTYHEDAGLRTQLARGCPTALRQHLAADMEWLARRFRECEAAYLRTAEVRQGFDRLLDGAMAMQPEPLVPVHNDPSPTNVLLVGGRFVFLDWDEVTLSDPMRDIGLLLWWNFPPAQWQVFFERYGLELSAARRQKIYWFAARASLDIALWHAEHGADGNGFTEDFLAAVKAEPNPKGY